jgi:hypothetical protein
MSGRWWCLGPGSRLVLGFAWLSWGCGQVAGGNRLPFEGTGGDAAGAGSGVVGGAGIGGAGASVGPGGSASAGSSGASPAGSASVGGQVAAEEPADIHGRWALFVFEDPVGVQLTQAGEQLGGRGCAGGTPPAGEAYDGFCGDAARFRFSFSIYTYMATTLISADGQRMTGSLHAVADVDMPTAWLRVPDGDQGLFLDSAARNDPLTGMYTLTLEGADAGATEYDAVKTYRLFYDGGRGIASDLGAFWNTEITRIESPAALQVGPVPPTSPELAVSMRLETSAGSLSRVRATTASGYHYDFAAARRQQ